MVSCLMRLLGNALASLGNVPCCVKYRPSGTGFQDTEVMVGQQVIQIELIVPLTVSDAIGAVL